MRFFAMTSKWALLSVRRASGFLVAVGMTFGCFLVLPVLQAIADGSKPDTILMPVDQAFLPPPPPPPPEEEPPPEEQEQEETPPELADDAPPPDLSELEMAVDFGSAGSWSGPDLALNIGTNATSKDDVNALFALSDLDQEPRVLFQKEPVIGPKERKQTPGSVHILFIVGPDGRVQNPRIQQSTHPIFERSALKAIKKWRFEPGKRDGKPVAYRKRVQISYPKT